MIRRLSILVAVVAMSLWYCFAAQAPPANAARPVAALLPVSVFDARESLKQRSDHSDCWCANGYAECIRRIRLSRDAALASLAKSHFNFFRPSTDVREIDLDGLKKILQRDPKDTRPLLVNFWATWCDGCREEFPDLVKIDNDYRDKGLNFISVTLDDITDIKTAVPQFLKEMKAQMPVVLLNVKDPEPAIHAVDEKWDGQLPATFLYDKDGKVVYKHFGVIKPAELRSAIDKAVMIKQ
jgi:thiol-disulfide isomerase/thioredoxin